MFDFPLHFSLFFFLFQTLFYYSKSSLSPTDFHEIWRGKLSIGCSWSIPVSSVFLYCTANVGSLEEIAAASTHGVSQQKELQLASINLWCSHGCCHTLAPMMEKWVGAEEQIFCFKWLLANVFVLLDALEKSWRESAGPTATQPRWCWNVN